MGAKQLEQRPAGDLAVTVNMKYIVTNSREKPFTYSGYFYLKLKDCWAINAGAAIAIG
jgi:hypothetical protein